MGRAAATVPAVLLQLQLELRVHLQPAALSPRHRSAQRLPHGRGADAVHLLRRNDRLDHSGARRRPRPAFEQRPAVRRVDLLHLVFPRNAAAPADSSGVSGPAADRHRAHPDPLGGDRAVAVLRRLQRPDLPRRHSGRPRGQREAARALGLRGSLIMWLVVLPQALRLIIPPLGNQFIAMLKDSSLVSVLGAWELMYMARTHGRAEFKYMEMLIAAALIYWGMSAVFELVQSRIERKFGKGVTS